MFIEATVWNFFIGKGFTEQQVAGIMGNVEKESTWNPLAHSKDKSYWGLFQIDTTQTKKLYKLYREADLDKSIYDYNNNTYWAIDSKYSIPRVDLMEILKIQLNFVYDKCVPASNVWKEKLRGADKPEKASEAFQVFFEGNTSTHTDANKILYYHGGNNSTLYYGGAAERRTASRTYYNNCNLYEGFNLWF